MAWRHFTVEMPFFHSHRKDKVTVSIDEEADIVQFRAHRSREVFTGQFTAMLEIYKSRLMMQKVEEARTKPRRRKFASRGLLTVGR
jgi:hypothetical protein